MTPHSKKIPKLEIYMQNGHNHCRVSGKYGRRAACGCGISLIPLRLGRVMTINCSKVDAEPLNALH